MTYIYDFLGICNGLTLLLALVLLLRGPFRKFWVVLAYVSWELFATAALTGFNVFYSGPAQVSGGAHADAVRLYTRLYWTNDVIVDLFRFFLVMVLSYRATPEGAKRQSMGRILGGVFAVVVVLPFVVFPLHFRPWPSAVWFNSTSEMLNFGAAIMNLVLWGALLSNRKRDPQLAVVSAGLGVIVTGAAVSYGLRHLVPADARFIPNLFLMLTQLVGFGIWCRTFWPARAPQTTLTPASGDPIPSA